MNATLSSARWLALAVAFGLAFPAPAIAADPAAIKAQLDKTAAEYARIESQKAKAEQKITDLERQLREADRVLGQKQVALRARAGYLYRSGGVDYVKGLVSTEDLNTFVRRVELLQRVGDQDAQLVDGLVITKQRSDELRRGLKANRANLASIASSLRAKSAQLQVQLKGAMGAARVGRYGKFDSFTLPINAAVAFADTWGAPRSRGRRHQGTDVMAACGAPVVAVTNGVISELHSGGMGGTMAWLRANNGDVFFYAHLRGYSAGTSEGRRVATGQLIAYNGNSGNARGGPCHVHFEWHPGGGRPRDPYPLLRAVR